MNTKQYKWPIGPRAYVDDHGLLLIGDNWETNNKHLAKAAKRLMDLLSEIGLKIDPVNLRSCTSLSEGMRSHHPPWC